MYASLILFRQLLTKLLTVIMSFERRYTNYRSRADIVVLCRVPVQRMILAGLLCEHNPRADRVVAYRPIMTAINVHSRLVRRYRSFIAYVTGIRMLKSSA